MMIVYLFNCFLQRYLLTLSVSLLALPVVLQCGGLADLVHDPESEGLQPGGSPLDSSLDLGASLAKHVRLLHELADDFLLAVHVIVVKLGVDITGHGQQRQDGGASRSWGRIITE